MHGKIFSNLTKMLICVQACTASAFGSGSILINPSDLYPEASGFLFGIMNTVGAIPGYSSIVFTYFHEIF